MGRWRSSGVWCFTARSCSARPRRMTVVLEISGLGKTYKSGHIALSDVDLSNNKGEIFALLGPNGAGTTTMNSIVRSEERRVGKECVSTGRSRWSPSHKKQNHERTT